MPGLFVATRIIQNRSIDNKDNSYSGNEGLNNKMSGQRCPIFSETTCPASISCERKSASVWDDLACKKNKFSASIWIY
jgi:hypothetical protein